MKTSNSYTDNGIGMFDKSSPFEDLETESLELDEIFSMSNKNLKKYLSNKIANNFSIGLNKINHNINKNIIKIDEDNKNRNFNSIGDLINKERKFKILNSSIYLLKSNSSFNDNKTLNINSKLNIIDKKSHSSNNDYQKTKRILSNMLGIPSY